MPIFKQKWFCEDTVPGKRFGKIKHCFLIDRLVFKGKSPYQEILIFDNPVYGRIFVLDGIVQLSETDEHIYHEMIAHPILFSHPNPQKVLIVGGGDGGSLREVLKHPLKEVYLVDIDKKVIEISEKYLPFVSKGAFNDKRLKLFIGDGAKFIKKFKDYFDIVIIDSNDPVGPSLALYSANFYKEVFKVLKKEGMMVAQIGSFLDFDNLIKKIFLKLKNIFSSVQIYRLTMPSYHCGEYCFIGASKKINLNKTDFKQIKKRFDTLDLLIQARYYSPEIHFASITIPKPWRI